MMKHSENPLCVNVCNNIVDKINERIGMRVFHNIQNVLAEGNE